MNGLLGIQVVRVPSQCVATIHEHLREMGELGAEGLGLWAGVATGETFEVREAIIPKQVAYRTSDGVCVMVEAGELHRLNVWLYQHQMTLIAQLHSHPRDAFHSSTDDSFPIATTLGSFSLVIPDFAQEAFDLSQCAVFRLTPDGLWTELAASEVTTAIRITE